MKKSKHASYYRTRRTTVLDWLMQMVLVALSHLVMLGVGGAANRNARRL